MLHWFQDRYELLGPQRPLLSFEQPVDVYEILGDQFDDIIPEDEVFVVAVRLDHRGDWVSKDGVSRRSRLLSASTPTYSFNAPRALQSRAQLTARLDALEAAVDALQTSVEAIRHNGAPRGPDDPAEPPSIDRLVDAMQALRGEAEGPKPSAPRVQRASKSISQWARVWDWFLKKADGAADAGLKAFAITLGTGLAGAILMHSGLHLRSVIDQAHATAAAAEEWLEAARSADSSDPPENVAPLKTKAIPANTNKAAKKRPRTTPRVEDGSA